MTTEKPTAENQERFIAWKISNKGKALKRITKLLEDAFS